MFEFERKQFLTKNSVKKCHVNDAPIHYDNVLIFLEHRPCRRKISTGDAKICKTRIMGFMPTKCALCLEIHPLRLSHIIPEFMFKPLYDQNHRFWGISSAPAKPNKVLQKGLRERLLCDHCEKQLSVYEDYACRVFFGEAAQKPIRAETGLLFAKLRYKSLKLFLMSLLWRFAVTSLREYKGLELGPHREKLRELIQAHNPADFLTFPCLITAITQNRHHIPDIIMQPAHTRFEQQHVWILIISGFLFQFFVSNRLPPQQMRGGFLREDGTMLLNISEISDIPSLRQWMHEIAIAERARKAGPV